MITEDTLRRLSVDIEGIEVHEPDTHPRLVIRTPDSGILIGNRGETLRALQYLVKRIVEQKTGAGKDAPQFLLDVNGYQGKRLDEIRNHAGLLAERARMFHYDVEMSPMNAYERMIVHAMFAEDPEITTQSQGEGKFRRVVISCKASANNSPPPFEADELNIDSRF